MIKFLISQSFKQKLGIKIRSLAAHSKDYTKHPKDFTINRKLTFETALKLLLSLGIQSFLNEPLSFFNFEIETQTASSFTQARKELKIDALKQLFKKSQSQTFSTKL